jgi:hypothetical protein
MGRPALEAVLAHRRPDVARADIERRFVTQGSRARYKTHPSGVMSRAEFGRPVLDLRVGFEKSAFESDVSQPELVLLVLDASSQMDRAWTHSDQGVSTMADLVFAIARRLHQVKGGRRVPQLVCAFLSSDQSIPVEPGTSATALEGRLQAIRKEHRLRFRGAFLRPAAERLLDRYHDRTKRLCVVSDGEVYDYDDTENDQFSARTWLTFKVGNLEPGRVGVSREQMTLAETVLDEHFSIPREVFRKVILSLGENSPVDWEPANGVLNRDDRNHLRLEFIVPDESSVRARIQFPGWAQPSLIAISGTMVRQGELTDFELLDYAVPGLGEPLAPPREGKLTDPELDHWQRFESSEWKCPKCGGIHTHLVDMPRMAVRARPIFDSLTGANGGYFLLEAGQREWFHFKTGMDLGDLMLVILEGKPYWTTANGTLQPVPAHDLHYRLEHLRRRWFLVPA